MASILQVPDVMSVVMGYVPEQWGTLAAVNWEGSRRANENGLELWERIARIPNVVFIAQHSAAIQSATTAKRKMKALGAILHNANGNEEERDLARVALENLGDHSTIFRGFGLLSDRVTNRYLLDSAIIHSDRTLFEAIDPEMFSPESIDAALEFALRSRRTEWLERLIPHASPNGLLRVLMIAIFHNVQAAAEPILKSKRAFGVGPALVTAAGYNATYIPLICESRRPFDTAYYPLGDFDLPDSGSSIMGLQAALFAAVDQNNISGIEALLEHSSPSLNMLRHARDRACLVHIYHVVNGNPLFEGQAREVLATLQEIRNSLPQRYRERAEHLILRSFGANHDLRPIIARLDLEIANRATLTG